MNDNREIVAVGNIKNLIFSFRGSQIMIDRDLAELYGVPTKRLNEQVKRNLNRFPESFRFQLTDNEKIKLVANCDRFEKLKHSSVNPYAFTEQGIAMLSAVLHSQTAVEVSVKIMGAFVDMRKFILNNATIFQRLDKIEQKQIEGENKFELLFQALENNTIRPKQGIFYEGQIFDAYKFVAELIKGTEKSIVLIDNYVDETVLTLFSKNQKVNVEIYTKNITKQLKLDLDKYNAQYKSIEIKKFNQAHDRFLIIDNKEVYHFGASLKDLGKKWFAFSKFDMNAIEMLGKLK